MSKKKKKGKQICPEMSWPQLATVISDIRREQLVCMARESVKEQYENWFDSLSEEQQKCAPVLRTVSADLKIEKNSVVCIVSRAMDYYIMTTSFADVERSSCQCFCGSDEEVANAVLQMVSRLLARKISFSLLLPRFAKNTSGQGSAKANFPYDEPEKLSGLQWATKLLKEVKCQMSVQKEAPANRTTLQSLLNKKMPANTSDAVRAEVLSCDTVSSISDKSSLVVEMSVAIRYPTKSNFVDIIKQTSTSKLTIKTNQPADVARKEILSQRQKCILNCINRIANTQAPTKLTDSACLLITQYESPFVRAYVEMPGRKWFVGREKGNLIVVKKAAGMPNVISSCSTTSLQKTLNTAMQLKRYNQLPTDPISFMRFARKFETLYGKLSMKIPRPPVTLRLNLKTRKISIEIGNDVYHATNLFKDGNTLDDFVSAIFAKVSGFADSFIKRKENQLKVLEGMNPKDFEILKFTHERGKSWYTLLNDEMQCIRSTTKISTGPCLDRLCEMKVQQDGKMVPLLTFQWKYSYEHDDFRLYTTPVEWVAGIFNEAKPRNYNRNEIADYFTTAGKESMFLRLVKACSTREDYWAALSYLEDIMSAQYAATFAKTAQGRNFFSHFEDTDALYAKFFLEGLPGCKRLAKEIFKKES